MTQGQYITELRYIRNVSSNTPELYGYSFKAFEGALENKQTVSARIGQLREKGVSPVSVNTYLRCVNAYFNWLHKEHGRELIRIPKLKEEQRVIASFSPEHVARVIHWKPVGRFEARLHTLALAALDTVCG